VLIAIGNSTDRNLTDSARRLLADGSPLVRGAAVWALSQLLARAAFEAIAAQALPTETDTGVREEWSAALEARCTGA
jgi:epoxyqueuosine reductase